MSSYHENFVSFFWLISALLDCLCAHWRIFITLNPIGHIKYLFPAFQFLRLGTLFSSAIFWKFERRLPASIIFLYASQCCIVHKIIHAAPLLQDHPYTIFICSFAPYKTVCFQFSNCPANGRLRNPQLWNQLCHSEIRILLNGFQNHPVMHIEFSYIPVAYPVILTIIQSYPHKIRMKKA